jgi:hypothetical protein
MDVKNILIVAFFATVALSLTACTGESDSQQINNEYPDKICIDGVVYHKIRGVKVLGIAVAYNADGTIKVCGE